MAAAMGPITLGAMPAGAPARRLPHLGACPCPNAFVSLRRPPPHRAPAPQAPARRPSAHMALGAPGRPAGRRLQCRADGARGAAFPAGRRQARVELPACFVSLSVEDAGENADKVGAAVSAGATGVLLLCAPDTGAAELYEAAVSLKSRIRGRACLLIADRTDIVNAAEADGVALSAKGLPTLVARRMLRAKDGLIAALAADAQEARTAARDGANLVLLQAEGGAASPEAIAAARSEQGSSGAIPIVVAVARGADPAGFRSADGVLLDLTGLDRTASAEQVRSTMAAFRGNAPQQQQPQQQQGEAGGQRQQPGLQHFLDADKEALLDAERSFLQDSLAFLQEATPQLEELGLMRDSIKQLDELFLMVVVGEFNSGKSSIINALLGGRFLAEGILPTTNEISVIKHSSTGGEELFQDADGQYVRRLPAELLRDVNIVDTPGTNVIVDRQQRLTEEFVPRADLVLFCMSADRPFTESETNFLKYIRQWGKKVVFVVNKVDILANDGEVSEVVRFVGDSATRLLGVERSQVLAVSARAALEAKVSVGGGSMAGGILSAEDAAALRGNPQWEASRFGPLESFILNFLVGGASAGETVRLKLQTPLSVAEALLGSAAAALGEQLQAARDDVAAVAGCQQQLASFRREMERDGGMQRAECAGVVADAVQQAQGLVDSTLQLANLDGLSGYLFGSGADASRLPLARSFTAAAGPAAERLERLVSEHSDWLQLNCGRQLANYREFAEAKSEQLGFSFQELTAGGAAGSSSSSSSSNGTGAAPAAAAVAAGAEGAEARQQWRESRALGQEGAASGPPAAPGAGAGQSSLALVKGESSLALVRGFDASAGALLLEEEVREAVIGTAGAAVGAGVLAFLATFILPNTLEDFLALAIGGLVGYSALLNLPLRRGDANGKLQRAAGDFLQGVDRSMEAELVMALDACLAEAGAFLQPLQRCCEEAVAKLEAQLATLEGLEGQLRELQQRAANVE